MKKISWEDIENGKYITCGSHGDVVYVRDSKRLRKLLDDNGYVWGGVGFRERISPLSLMKVHKDRIICIYINNKKIYHSSKYYVDKYYYLNQCEICNGQLKEIKEINDTIQYCPKCLR